MEVDLLEAQEIAGERAIDGERRASNGSTAQRILVSDIICRLEPVEVPEQYSCVVGQPVGNGDGLSVLDMCV